MAPLDKLHIALAVFGVVAPILSALLVTWLKSHGHPQAAEMAATLLKIVVEGVEKHSFVTGDDAVKETIKQHASEMGVEHILNPVVQQLTQPTE